MYKYWLTIDLAYLPYAGVSGGSKVLLSRYSFMIFLDFYKH